MILESTPRHEVNQQHPCPICQGRTSCSLGEDMLIMCRRRTGAQAGARYLGQAKKQPEWALYRLEGDPRLFAGDGVQRSAAAPNGRKENGAKAKPRIAWLEAAKEHAAQLTEDRRAQLAILLGLPISCTYALPLLGFRADTRFGPCWTFPEIDAQGEVCGLVRRLKDGRKIVMAKGCRGLTFAAGWEEGIGPLYIPEGASDVLALAALGLCAVGRPNDQGAVQQLAHLLKDQPAGRDLIVMGEWDMKPDGKWPGLAGAVRAAEGLAAALGRAVSWALPPDKAKDVRAWASGLGGANETPELWTSRGQKFQAALQLQKVAPAEQKEEKKPGLVLERFDEVEPKVIHFLVPGYVPLGQLVLLAGAGKQGKSIVTTSMVAALTRGRCCLGLDYAPPPPCSVLIASKEDGSGETLLPRLLAAGADLSKVCKIKNAYDKEGNILRFSISNIPNIEAELEKDPSIRLLIIDPITAYIAATGVDDFRDDSLRDAVIEPLRELAEKYTVTILVVKHLNKSTGTKASALVAGSAAYVDAMRAAYIVLPTAADKRIKNLCCLGITNAEMPDTLTYRLKLLSPDLQAEIMADYADRLADDTEGEEFANQLLTVDWMGAIDADADAICAENAAPPEDNDFDASKAAKWLADFLSYGPRSTEDCVEQGNRDCKLRQSARWWRDRVLVKQLNGGSRKERGIPRGRWFFCLEKQEPPVTNGQ